MATRKTPTDYQRNRRTRSHYDIKDTLARAAAQESVEQGRRRTSTVREEQRRETHRENATLNAERQQRAILLRDQVVRDRQADTLAQQQRDARNRAIAAMPGRTIQAAGSVGNVAPKPSSSTMSIVVKVVVMGAILILVYTFVTNSNNTSGVIGSVSDFFANLYKSNTPIFTLTAPSTSSQTTTTGGQVSNPSGSTQNLPPQTHPLLQG